MHPGVIYRWKCARSSRQSGEEARAHGHAYAAAGAGKGHHARPTAWRAGEFGVRRPLRFMAHRLELDEGQVQILARILNDLKTERAQRSVDESRSLSQIADALDQETFDANGAEEALKLRMSAQQRVSDAVLKALRETHAMLSPQQRAKLVYMLRSGQLSI